jgi:hypothetical protein
VLAPGGGGGRWLRVASRQRRHFDAALHSYMSAQPTKRHLNSECTEPLSALLIPNRERAMPFQQREGNWTDLRAEFGLTRDDEIDLHFGRRDLRKPYDEAMDEVAALVKRSLIEAQNNGRPYVIFTHGWSTSRPGQVTARSVVRRFMRSKEATLFIERSGCVQHPSAFVAKIRLTGVARVAVSAPEQTAGTPA